MAILSETLDGWAEEFLQHFLNPQGNERDGWLTHCPAPDHPDQHPSLKLDLVREPDGCAKMLGYCRSRACSHDAINAGAKLESRDWFFHPAQINGKVAAPSSEKPAKMAPTVTMIDYSQAKLLPIEFLEKQFGLKQQSGGGFINAGIKIPYHRIDGSVACIKIRNHLNFEPRFHWPAAQKLFAYNLPAIPRAEDTGTLSICEGESDTQTAEFHGFVAIGLAGATQHKTFPLDEIVARPKIRKLQIFADADGAGRTLVRNLMVTLHKAKWESEISVLDLPDGDLNALHVSVKADGAKFKEAVAALLKPYDPNLPPPHDAADAETASNPDADETDHPQIVINVGQLRDKVTQALEALEAANDPAVLFTRGGFLTRLGRGNDGVLDLLDADGLLAELAEAADWKKFVKKLHDAEPSSNIVRAIRGRRFLPFPPIEGVMRAPFFSADGELIVDPGYDPRTWTYLALDPKLASQLAALSFPDHPRDDEVADARALVLEPFAQFPFADNASLANTIGLELIPFERKMINGLIALHGATAPPEAAGTGKSILVQTACVPGVGEVDSTPEVGNADELRKKLLPVIINDLPVFLFDNVIEELSGGVLASILTTRNLAERILGHTKLFRGKVHTAFAFTANGARCSTEIRRRTNWIRLDAGMAEPWKRTGFTKELPAWAFEHRAELIRACIILIRHWINVGRPAGTVMLGGFEPWSRVIGGILETSGIKGFLTNLDDAAAYDADVGAAHWHNFIQAWHADHGEKPVVAGALIESAIACSIVKEVFDFDAARRERSIATKLGVAITYHLGQTFAIDSVELTITRASVQRAGGRTNPGFALVQAKPAEKVREVRETGQKLTKSLKTKGNFSPDLSKKGQGKKSKSAKVRGAQVFDSKGKSRISPDLPDVPDLFGRSGKRKKKNKF